MPAPMGTDSHLWASQVTESASSMPARCARRAGLSRAPPPQAASACSHRPWRSATWRRGPTGSSTPVPVAPRVATTMSGCSPAARSRARRASRAGRSRRRASSRGISRTAPVPSPAMRAALTKLWWASAERYTVGRRPSAVSPCSSQPGNFQARAHWRAETLASAPPVVKVARPWSSLQPMRPMSTVSTRCSSSKAAGAWERVATWGLYRAARASASTLTGRTLGLNRPK